MFKLCCALLPLLTFSSCVIDDTQHPRVLLDLEVATSETRRGMVQSESPVLMPKTTVVLPAKEKGSIIIAVDGSVELSDDTGNAWRPDNQSGRFAAFDWSVIYGQALGDYTVNLGVVSYNVPNGRQFPLGARGSTAEVLLEIVTKIWGVTSSLRANYDVDEADGLYLLLGGTKNWKLNDDWGVALNVDLGWMDEDQAFWNYAQVPSTSGLADLRATTQLTRIFDEHTSVSLEAGFSELVDSEFKDWFDIINIDTTQTWLGLAVHWSY